MFPFRTDILEEHADEAAFLRRQRSFAWDSPLRTPASIAFLDERIQAHLDGLIVAGEAGHAVAAAGFKEEEDAGPAFVAVMVALGVGTPKTLADLRRALPKIKIHEDLRLALTVATGPVAERFLADLAGESDPKLRGMGLAALAARGTGVSREAAARLLRSEHPEEVQAGLLMAGHLQDPGLDPLLSPHLEGDSPHASLALETAFRIGSPRALSLARLAAQGSGARASGAVHLLGLAGEERDLDNLIAALRRPETARAACVALGRHGHPDAGTALVDAAAAPWGRAAGHAFEVMTGIDIAGAGLIPDEEIPEGDADEIPESGEDAFEVELDDDYPLPDPAKLRRWWDAALAEIPPGTRMRRGRPFSFETCLAEVREGRAPDREAAIRECVLRLPGISAFPLRAWFQDQLRTQGAWEAEVNDIAGQIDLRVSRGWPVLAAVRG